VLLEVEDVPGRAPVTGEEGVASSMGLVREHIGHPATQAEVLAGLTPHPDLPKGRMEQAEQQ
jgi:hypothetical protein